MKSNAGTLAAPFPWFGGKSGACSEVWTAFGSVDNYVEPFAGSAAMLLGAPDGKRVETINDADGFVANFWRAVSRDADAVAAAADWPTNEVDLFARHGHAGEHDALLAHGWHTRTWTARKGYAVTDEAVENSASETLWCSPHCMPAIATLDLFSDLEIA